MDERILIEHTLIICSAMRDRLKHVWANRTDAGSVTLETVVIAGILLAAAILVGAAITSAVKNRIGKIH
jgi:hypothetical protein